MPTPSSIRRFFSALETCARGSRLLGVVVLGCLLTGCAAVSNPVGDGIPVRRLPPEIFGRSKEEEKRVPLSKLRQPPSKIYKLGPGDVLGVYIEGVLGERNVAPPTRFSEQGNLPPAIGFPLPIREDGTVPVPLIKPVKVDGLSITDAQAAIIRAYTVKDEKGGKEILKPDRNRIIVTLIRPRQYRVLVLREDAGSVTTGTSGGFNTGLAGAGTFFTQTRRATGFNLDLPAYENDVLTALTRSGGLPGPEAENEVIIYRGTGGSTSSDAASSPGACPGNAGDAYQRIESGEGQMTTIPLRYYPDNPPRINPKDVLLETGDIVLVKLRRGDTFYTAGLLPARIYPLPRDRDLDVLQAMALVGAPLYNGNFNANNLSGSVVQSGIGFPSPSMLTVVRKTVSGRQIPIRVDLNRALRDPRERIFIQPGDVLVLQETVLEAVTRYIDTNLRINILGTFIRQEDLLGTANLSLP